VVNQDLDPALHYVDIPAGCRLSNGLGVCFMVLLVLAVYALTNLKSASAANRSSDLPKGRADDITGGGGIESGSGGGGGGGGDDYVDRVYYGTAQRQAPVRGVGSGLGGGGGHRGGGGHGAEDSVTSLVLAPGFEVPTADLGGGGGDDDDDDFSTLEGSRLLG
jgi:hypothetical protein